MAFLLFLVLPGSVFAQEEIPSSLSLDEAIRIGLWFQPASSGRPE